DVSPSWVRALDLEVEDTTPRMSPFEKTRTMRAIRAVSSPALRAHRRMRGVLMAAILTASMATTSSEAARFCHVLESRAHQAVVDLENEAMSLCERMILDAG